MSRAIILASLWCAGSAFAGDPPEGVWVERDDAGNLPASAQHTGGAGALREIRGRIGGGEDMFCIRITDTRAFRASTVGGSIIDTQLWLFNREGRGVVFCDDAASGGVQSAFTGHFVPAPGTYFLAISQYDDDALDGDGREIWGDTPFAGERAPDGPGAAHRVSRWSGHAEEPLTEYTIFLQGAAFCEVPAPGSLGLLALSGLAVSRRRR